MYLKNVSGFRSCEDSHGNIQAPDINEFKRICYTLPNIDVISFDFDLNNKSYYIAELRNKKAIIYLLLNAHYPYIAFASNNDRFNLKFIFNSELDVVLNTYYEVLRPELLDSNLSKDDFSKLDVAELKQVSYFDSRTYGQFIYNFWD